MVKSLGDVALSYATKLNFQVFPLKERDKVPLGGHGCKDGTADAARIKAWWGSNDTANIGLACGENSGVWVLDIDGKIGEADLAYLEATHGRLPETPCAKTANGRHFYFKYPEGVKITNRAKIIPHAEGLGGIDVRAAGGYVVLPPSVHPSGVIYSWIKKPSELPFAVAPDWLMDLVIKKHEINGFIPSTSLGQTLQPVVFSLSSLARRTGPDDIINDQLEAVRTAPEGVRNNTLHIAAIKLGKLMPGGFISENEAVHQLSMAAKTCGIGAFEANATILSGLRYGMGDPYQYGGFQHGSPSHTKFDADRVVIDEPEPAIPVAGLTIHAPTLLNKPIPPRIWLADGWILNGCVTALYGDGGAGKSLLAMQLLTAVTLGQPFLGIEVKRQKVFGFFCEDSADELHRRQEDINCHYNCTFSDLDGMYWQSRVGLDNVLMAFIRDGAGSATAAYEYLRIEVMRVGAQCVVLDTAADTFGGNENMRPQVRQFINLLSRLALEIDGSVILCAHPSAAGLARNDGTGGSTAWNNTVRSRLYFSRPERKDGEEMTDEEAQNLRQLVKMKSNYSTIGDKIVVKWDNGAFKTEASDYRDKLYYIEKSNQDRADDELFLRILDSLNRQTKYVSDSKSSRYNYAPKVMANSPEGKGVKMVRFEKAMERLFDNESITNGEVGVGSNRHKKIGIIRKKIG